MNIQNTEPKTIPIMLNQRFIQNTEESNKFNQLYDENFITLINGLNESIKEYYKVSKNNIIEANSILSLYEQNRQEIQLLLESITNSNSIEKVNEVFGQILKINEIITHLQLNANSNDKNLELFFDDAKVLFQKMKMKRKQKIIKINNLKNHINRRNSTDLNDSFSKSMNTSERKNKSKNKLFKNRNIQQNSKRSLNIINKNSTQRLNTSTFLIPINKIYFQIIGLINRFSEFNYMISKMNYEASNKYNNLQNDIKKEIDALMNLVKSNFSNNEQNHSPKISIGTNLEIEKLKKNNQIYEQKIFELNNQIKAYRKNLINNNLNELNYDSGTKIRELEIKNN